MKKLISLIVIVIIILGAYFYFTRPASAPSESADSAATSTNATSTGATYRISKEKSLVSFHIDEMLNGKPKHVVGTTTDIGGTITLSDTGLNIGTLAINARTFVTDDARRNGAIARLILKSESEANQFIYFKPTDIKGLSTTSPTGTVSGDLTISGITKPAVFEVSMNINGNTITGTATTTIKRADFNLVIPNIPFVANVDENVTVVTNITAEKI